MAAAIVATTNALCLAFCSRHGHANKVMEFYADLHIHSKYSRATAKSCDLAHLALWARKKGIALVGTGDFTHPGWMADLEDGLAPAEQGLYRLRDELQRKVDDCLPAACTGETRFMLSAEISTIYKKGERTRKVHHVVYAPDFEGAKRIASALSKIGNITSDGRPILGLDSRNLLEIVLDAGTHCYLVPAHIWTPWFSALGSKSGFDAIDDCYGDLAKHIFAVETGLSSDPAMNWQVSSLDRFRLVSNSDAHSPPMLGREANIFDGPLDYHGIRNALESGAGYVGTVEFFPEEGKYHLDGHRNCGVCLTPTQTRELDCRCPICGKPVTVGVMHRVAELADRQEGSPPETAGAVRSFVPLPEILGELRGVGAKSKSVARAYEALLAELGPELYVLGAAPLEEVRRVGSERLAEALARLRAGRVIRKAGYDGQYGVIRLFADDELAEWRSAGSLFGQRAARTNGRTPAAAVDDEEPQAAPPPGNTTATISPPKEPASARTLPLFGAAGGGAPASDVLTRLDPEQRAAAEVTVGPLLIVAGPGSGKTRTLTHRVAHLIATHGVPADQCLTITFTRRAAEELRERLQGLLPDLWPQVPVCTFHRLGLSILRAHTERAGLEAGFRIADSSEQVTLLNDTLEISERQARALLPQLSRAKRGGCAAQNIEIDHALRSYERGLRERGLVDFDDLVGLAVRVLESDADIAASYRDRYRWLSIDEYQDVDPQQYRLVRQLTPPDGNVCAIGDPDQAIYGFRGADVGFFLRFQQDFPSARVVRLVRNYRSGRAIVEASGQVIERGGAAATSGSSPTEHLAMEAMREGAGRRITIHAARTDRAEAEFVIHTLEQLLGGHSFFSVDSGRTDGVGQAALSFSDFAVLFRTAAQADVLCEALERSGMPYQRRSHERLADQPGVRELVGGLQRAAAAGPVLHQLRAAASQLLCSAAVESDLGGAATPADDPLPADLVQAALDLLEPLATACQDDAGRFFAELALGEQVDSWDPRADRVSLLTLHAAKGLEFPVVFIVGCEDGLLPLRWADDDGDREEERRLFYVGMTRAEQRLFLCHAQKRRRHGKLQPASPSPFLKDIEEQLLQRSKSEARSRRPEEPPPQLELF